MREINLQVSYNVVLGDVVMEEIQRGKDATVYQLGNFDNARIAKTHLVLSGECGIFEICELQNEPSVPALGDGAELSFDIFLVFPLRLADCKDKLRDNGINVELLVLLAVFDGTKLDKAVVYPFDFLGGTVKVNAYKRRLL